MATTFYARIQGKVFGPFDTDKVRRLAAAGKISRDDSLSADGKTKWTLAGNVKGLFPPAELLVGDEPAAIPTVVRKTPPAITKSAPVIPQAVPAQPAQPTVVYVQAPAAAPQQIVQNTTVVVHGPKLGNTCATLAIGLGILSIVVAFVPFLGLLVFFSAGLTLLLALFGCIIALTRRGTGFIGSVVGGVLALVALPIALLSTGAGVSAGVGAVERAREASRQAQDAQDTTASADQPAGSVETPGGP